MSRWYDSITQQWVDTDFEFGKRKREAEYFEIGDPDGYSIRYSAEERAKFGDDYFAKMAAYLDGLNHPEKRPVIPALDICTSAVTGGNASGFYEIKENIWGKPAHREQECVVSVPEWLPLDWKVEGSNTIMPSGTECAVLLTQGARVTFEDVTVDPTCPGPFVRIEPGCQMTFIQKEHGIDLYTGEQVAAMLARAATA